MNKNHKLSETTFGPRHVQPHQPKDCATKKKRTFRHLTVQEQANRDLAEKR